MLLFERHNEDLQRHMYKLYQDGDMCDLELFSQDGVSYRVHRLVLTASSKYLYNLCIQSTDFTSFPLNIKGDVLHVLLEFCYTGKLFLTAERWADLQEGAVILQMYNVLELLSKQKGGTSHINENIEVGNQSQTGDYRVDNNKDNSATSQYKLEGQTNIDDNETLEGNQSNQIIIVKEEVPMVNEEGNPQGSSSYNNTEKVRIAKYKTRSCSKVNETKNDVKDVEYLDDPNHSKRSTAFTGVKGRRSSSKVNSSDPDYEPEIKKVKIMKTRVIKTRSKKNCKETENVKIFNGSDEKRQIFIRIKNSKIKKSVGCNRRKKAGRSINRKVFVPKGTSRSCPDCSKTFMSSVLLHRHQLCVHFTKNCSGLRHIHTVKLSKHSSDISNCEIDKTFPPPLMKFKCRVCNIRFTKYCQFTLHHRKRHKNLTRPLESWLRYCSVKLAMQKLLVPFAKDRNCNSGLVSTTKGSGRKQKERTFQCTYCNKMLLTHYTLEAHKRNMHGDMGGREIIRREKIVPPEPLFVCADCNKSKGTLRALNHHLQLQHKYSSSEANSIQHWLPASLPCEHCEYKTRDLQIMKTHVTEAHPFVKYQCTECSLTFKVLLLMKRHRFSCHVIGKYNFHCQHCEKSFKKGSMLRKHEYFKHGIEHDDVKIFFCKHPGCTYKTYASTAIKLHQNKHVTEKLFPCEYCGLKLKTKLIHEKHVAKMHLGIRPFLCQVCGLNFGEKHELQSHITNKHSNERNYQCQFCSYRTAVKATFFTHVFNVHKVRAEEDKRELFSCPHCPFTSILKYRYQTHLNGHTNTRNYECKLCSKTFVSANTLRSHKQWVHSDKVYSCSQCDYQTKTSQKIE
ncbi:zinc finger protein 780B-like [Ruditapes philippinarum]|uniref:zinc finger protein 780B-like n=1 Tax=Ruditapes philippinarum TaxID=129788 RepID=UPI00295A9D7E|nr:zinc finger protein 780B-like [Ruditapes philippinarum]